MKHLWVFLLLIVNLSSNGQGFQWVHSGPVLNTINSAYTISALDYQSNINSIYCIRHDQINSLNGNDVFGSGYIEKYFANGGLQWQVPYTGDASIKHLVSRSNAFFIGLVITGSVTIAGSTIPYVPSATGTNMVFVRMLPNGTVLLSHNLTTNNPGFVNFDDLNMDPAGYIWYALSDGMGNAKVCRIDNFLNVNVTIPLSNIVETGNIGFSLSEPYKVFISGIANGGYVTYNSDSVLNPYPTAQFCLGVNWNNGIFAWTLFGNNPNYYEPKIAVDSFGQVYLANVRTDSISFNGYPIGIPGSTPDFFVIKINTSGNVIWSLTQPLAPLGSSGSFITGSNRFMDVDSVGNLYLGGRQNGLVDWNGFTSNTGNPVDTLIAIAKINPAGQVQWVKTGGSPSGSYLHSVVVNALGEVYFTGSFRDTAVFDTQGILTTNEYNFVVGKIDPLLVSLNEEPSQKSSRLFPNPATHTFSTGLEEHGACLEITDITGKSYLVLENYHDPVILPEGIVTGLYFVRITAPVGNHSFKLAVNR